MQKGQIPIVQTALGIAILVILVSVVVMPQVFSPTVQNTGSATVSTDIGLAAVATSTNSTSFTLTTPDTSRTGSLVITFASNGSTDRAINITTPTGTRIVSLNASPATVTIPASSIGTTTRLNFTTNQSESNITNMVLTYTQQSQQQQQGWSTQTIAVWAVLGLGVAISVLVYIFRIMA